MCVVNITESERYHSMGSPLDRAPPGLKTNRDHLMKEIWAMAFEDPSNGCDIAQIL